MQSRLAEWLYVAYAEPMSASRWPLGMLPKVRRADEFTGCFYSVEQNGALFTNKVLVSLGYCRDGDR